MNKANYLDFSLSKDTPFMRDVFMENLFTEAKKDKNIFLLTPDMGAPMLDKFRKELPKQFIHSGISEQHMIDFACGLAMSGKKVFCYAMAPFITSRTFDQLKCAAAAMNVPITLVGIGVGLGYADAGPTHYTTEDIACMRSLSNIEILTPCDNTSAKKMVLECIKNPKFRFIRLDREILKDVYEKFEINKFETSREIINGNSTAIITCGYLIHRGLKIIQDLNRLDQKLNIGLIDLYKIKPINKNDDLKKIMVKYKNIISIEEQTLFGGFGSAILEYMNIHNINLNLIRFGLDDIYYFENGGRNHLLDKYGLNSENIKQCILKL
tara:strand:- start:2144 stop:3115 length:972 start_codon:yes stop_codon:yes gene_type:complete